MSGITVARGGIGTWPGAFREYSLSRVTQYLVSISRDISEAPTNEVSFWGLVWHILRGYV